MATAILAERFYVPLDAIGSRRRLATIKARLTLQPQAYGEEEKPEPIVQYDMAAKPGYIGVPIEWGLKEFPDIEIEERLSRGGRLIARRYPDPFHERAAPDQDVFMADMLEAVQTHYAVLAVAPTGSGKTITALNTASRLKRRTLVIVPLERLAYQWVEEAKAVLGLKDEEIGWVQQDRCEYDKQFVVAIIHSVAMREYAEEFYHSFGTVIYDEVHRTAANLFSQTVGKFSAIFKLALTATPKRRDGLDAVYKNYFGPGYVKASSEALSTDVVHVRYPVKTKMFGKKHGAKIKALTRNKKRNAMLTDWIMRLYADGRNVLVIGESILHLQDLMARCVAAGMDAEDQGQFTGDRYTGEKRPSYVQVKRLEKNEICVYFKGLDEEAPTCYEKYERLKVVEAVPGETGLYRVRSQSSNMEAEVFVEEVRRVQWVDEKVKLTKEHFDRVKAEAKVLFATYGIMKEGIDIPRLDAGIDVTPRSDAEQVIGRIRRPMANKRKPVWVTIDDTSVPEFAGYTRSRLRDYRQCNARIIDDDECGL